MTADGDPKPFEPDPGKLWVNDGEATFRVPVEDLRFPRNVTAGCNTDRIVEFRQTLRCTTGDPDPIEVTREPDGTWRVSDGRHRFIAAVMAGRPDVLCVEAKEA